MKPPAHNLGHQRIVPRMEYLRAPLHRGHSRDKDLVVVPELLHKSAEGEQRRFVDRVHHLPVGAGRAAGRVGVLPAPAAAPC